MRKRRHPIQTRAVLFHGVQNGPRVVGQLVFGPTAGQYKHFAELRDIHTGLQKVSITVRVRGSALQFENGASSFSNSYMKIADPFTHPSELFRGPKIHRSASDDSEVLIVELRLDYPDKSIPSDDKLLVQLTP